MFSDVPDVLALDDRLRSCERRREDTLTVNAILYEIQQDGVAELNRIESPTARVVVNGNAIRIDPAQEDNGIWLEDVKTGVKVADGDVSHSDSSTCHVTFPTLPATGRYRLAIATRDGDRGGRVPHPPHDARGRRGEALAGRAQGRAPRGGRAAAGRAAHGRLHGIDGPRDVQAQPRLRPGEGSRESAGPRCIGVDRRR